MSIERALRLCMLGLVLLNLVFVHWTGSASLAWLMPLYALTLLSPLLERLRELVLYQWAWNAAVLAFFVVLLRHATGEELRYVLEDGLVLAVLCQVHLLNNLGRRQRPDLLFLNSFLIAVVTSFLVQDLAFAGTFVIYAMLLVTGLQLRCLTREGREPAGPPGLLLVRVVRGSLAQAAILLTATLGVFLFVPRDFHRDGFLVGALDFAASSEHNEIGFNDEVKLDRQGRSRTSERVVLRAHLTDGTAIDVPSLWRGATSTYTDGKRWWGVNSGVDAASLLSRTESAWEHEGRRWSRTREGAPPRTLVTVEQIGEGSDRLFLPLPTAVLNLEGELATTRVSAQRDGTFSVRRPRPTPSPLRYQLGFEARAKSELGGPVERDRSSLPAAYVALPRGVDLSSAQALATRLARGTGAGTPQHVLVERFESYLRENLEYLPPGSEGAATDLDSFLAGRAGGHCEFFAAALTVMLRSRGVPCRVATGYRAVEWDGAARNLTIRQRDAHAWVEVYDPLAGWYSVDAVPDSAAEHVPSLWARTRTALESCWAYLTSFDSARRKAALAFMRQLPARAWAGLCAHPGASSACALALAALLVVRQRRRRRRTPRSLRIYARVLRQVGLALLPGETPRELLDRARSAGLSPERWSLLDHATQRHERARYASWS